jgi:hypothetical protein
MKQANTVAFGGVTERRAKLATTISAGLFAVLTLSGCASQEHLDPTHRWVSNDDAAPATYRVDNAYCTRESTGSPGQRAFEPGTPEYDQYTACMKARGYALTAMNETATR